MYEAVGLGFVLAALSSPAVKIMADRLYGRLYAFSRPVLLAPCSTRICAQLSRLGLRLFLICCHVRADVWARLRLPLSGRPSLEVLLERRSIEVVRLRRHIPDHLQVLLRLVASSVCFSFTQGTGCSLTTATTARTRAALARTGALSRMLTTPAHNSNPPAPRLAVHHGFASWR